MVMGIPVGRTSEVVSVPLLISHQPSYVEEPSVIVASPVEADFQSTVDPPLDIGFGPILALYPHRMSQTWLLPCLLACSGGQLLLLSIYAK